MQYRWNKIATELMILEVEHWLLGGFTILLSFLLYMFEIIHNKHFKREKEKKSIMGEGNRAASALERIRTIYVNSSLFSICEYCAQKIQDTVYVQSSWSQINSPL